MSSFPDWLQVDFSGARAIDEIDLYSLHDNYTTANTPTETQTFTLYGLTAFDIQYWNGTNWATIPGGAVTSNNKVWRKFTFSPITTTKIRVLITTAQDGWSRVVELEAWGPSASTNVALAANGAVATASSTYACCGFSPVGAINGNYVGPWGNGDGWNDATEAVSPDWLQVDFNGSKTIGEIDVYTLHDNYTAANTPSEGQTFTLFGITAFDVQYWNGSNWATIPGGSVAGNNKVWRKFTFSPITTTRIRVLINGAQDVWSRIVELQAWSTSGSGGTPSDFATARLDPLNRTGAGGEDLLSNNFNWNVPLVSLPGRSGLDLGLALSYNSLVWTKAGNSINFDLDAGSIAPGFRLGFPTIEGPYFNSQANANFYLLITPSGGRRELRQVGTSIVYESKDSTYLQLIDNLNGTLTLRPTDGSQMSFIGVDGAWRCHQIKDRNGNFISATYKSWGELETVTDTLARVLTFNYDDNDNIQSITQTWGGQTHVWATFGWGTASIGNNFPGLNNLGPNSTSIPVVTQVGLPDGSRYNFEYNNTYGMVSKIRHHASDNRLRRQTTYVTPANAGDCPRLSERRDWAANWNGDSDENPTTSEEAITYFAHDADSGCRITVPDGTVQKEYYGSTWQSGLTTETRSYATVADANSNAWQKKTTTTWTQDNPNVSYKTNPRVIETNVYDSGGNRRRTTIDYGVAAYTQYGLPYFVTEYAANGVTELRRTYTDYDLNQAYLDRRIIGLVAAIHVTDASGFQAKVTYNYDSNALNSQATTATMHDHSYNSSFTVRGNVTGVSRWDVTDIVNPAKALTTTATYNAAGSLLSTTDPASHTNSLSYSESFSDGNNSRNTFAYPTTVTDAGGFQSLVQYNFDSGMVARAQGPPPAGQSQGRIQTMLYDNALRLTRVTTENTGAYTRHVYGPYYVMSFSTVNAVADDAYSCQILDGHGRTYAASGNHPNSTGWYRGQLMSYDIMGRIRQQTNWTEIDHAWVPVGDDATGWQWNNPAEYDWQGRALKTYNMDGTFKEASYVGCGCAGGEVVTLMDEVGRQQKVYSDVVGRQWKAEILNWNGSVYSATTNTFNTRDEVTLVRQWAGAENGGGAYQDTMMSYDGYGRLQSKHVPEQNAGTATVYAYNADDTIQAVTDARGASATYGYNSRHLVTSINYSAPAGITPTPNVTFGFDAAGNRTSMTDGLGSASYTYDQLSRMSSETRTFTGVPSLALAYDYNLAGQLKSLTDPANSRVNYAFDSAGRLNNITGTNYGISQFLTAASHRASGQVKQASYGNGRTLSMTYDARLRVSHLEMPGVMNFDYEFYNDGSLKYSHDVLDPRFDRSYEYDHVGRLNRGLSGAEARGEAPTANRPYYQTYTRDAFDHLTNRVTKHWSKNTPYISVDSYTNNRRTGWSYDAEGNLTDNTARQYGYDAAGQISFVSGSNLNQYFDGDGQRVKTVEPNLTTYYIHSTVLGGQVIAEMDGSGTRQRGFIFHGTKLLAEQWQNGSVVFVVADASGKSIRYTDSQAGNAFILNELDPFGAESEREDPYPLDPGYDGRDEGGALFPGFGNITQPSTGCTLDGVYALCEWLERGLQNGSTQIQITAANKPTKVPIKDFGLGLFGIWIEQDGRRLDNHQTQVGDEFDEHDVIVTNIDSDGLGDWIFISTNSAQKPSIASDINELVHCDPKVKTAISTMMQRANMNHTEAGFRVDRDPSNGALIVSEIFVGASRTEVSIPGINQNTVARFHTHDEGRYPSASDRKNSRGESSAFKKVTFKNGKPAYGHKTVSYVLSRGGLTLYNGANPKDSKGRDRLISAPPCPK